MRFFRRGGSEPDGADFWAWWAGARERIANAIETGGFDARLVDEISKAVRGVDPRLAWEFAAGQSSRHALCVSPEGSPELRPAALRWLTSAPPADPTWEYHASRQASPTLLTLEIGGVRMDLGEMRAIASWDETRRRADVRLWHPAFEHAPAPLRQQASFLFLDNLLGEDEVERWIGQIEALDAPTGGRTPDELKAEVLRRATEPAGNTWILAQRTGPRGEADVVLADAALKRIDHPFADQHVAITIVLEGGGMPDDAFAATLNAEEDRLVGRLRGDATLAGRTTAPGERVIHLVAEDLDRVRSGIDAWAQDLPPWRIKVAFQQDPDWSFQRELGVR
jgi:hypothetical protein